MQQICDVESQIFGAESPGFVRRTQRIGPVIVPSGTYTLGIVLLEKKNIFVPYH